MNSSHEHNLKHGLYEMVGGVESTKRLAVERQRRMAEYIKRGGKDPSLRYTGKGRSRGRWRPKVLEIPKTKDPNRWIKVCLVAYILGILTWMMGMQFFIAALLVTLYCKWSKYLLKKRDERLKPSDIQNTERVYFPI